MLHKSPLSVSAAASPRRRWRVGAAAMLALVAAAGGAAAIAIDSGALWTIVHRLCVPDQKRLRSPAPCATVNLEDGEQQGAAVLKDLIGRTQFLLIPTRRLAGIEDPLVGTDALPNYWRAAWAARGLVEKNAPKALARDDIGMAVNGAGARTQDQLHIHIDCVRPLAQSALKSRIGEIGLTWSDFRIGSKTYRVRRIVGAEPEPDPFRLLADDPQSAPLRDNSLAVIGATFAGGAPGFVLVALKAPGGKAHLEGLLDHSCAVAGG